MSVSLVKSTETDIMRLLAIVQEDSGDAPCSRYGTRAYSWSPWVVASFYASASANGWPDSERDALDEHASRVVNDSSAPAADVLDRWELLPREVRALVGRKRDVRALAAE